MATTFLGELFTVRDEILGRINADAPLEVKVEEVTRGIFNAAGILVRAFDEHDRDTDLATLKRNLATVLRDTADMLLHDNQYVNGLLQAFAMPIADGVIEYAAGYADGVETFISDEISSRIRRWGELLVYGADQLEGKLPPAENGVADISYPTNMQAVARATQRGLENFAAKMREGENMAKKANAGGAILAAIPWDKIFALADKMIEECVNKGVPPTETVKQVQNPSPALRRRVERVTRRNVPRNVWRENKDEIMAKVWAEAKRTSEQQVLQAIARIQADGPRSDAEVAEED